MNELSLIYVMICTRILFIYIYIQIYYNMEENLLLIVWARPSYTSTNTKNVMKR